MTTFTAKVLEICDNGDAIVELPPELLKEMGWKEGDTLDISEKDGKIFIKKIDDEDRKKIIRQMIDYYEALREMHKGNVVKYVGTVNGNVMSDNGASFCMCRGCIFLFDDGVIKWNKLGYMVYDPDFRYELTGETVDPRAWKPERNRNRRDIKSKLSYSRIGLGNV